MYITINGTCDTTRNLINKWAPFALEAANVSPKQPPEYRLLAKLIRDWYSSLFSHKNLQSSGITLSRGFSTTAFRGLRLEKAVGYLDSLLVDKEMPDRVSDFIKQVRHGVAVELGLEMED